MFEYNLTIDTGEYIAPIQVSESPQGLDCPSFRKYMIWADPPLQWGVLPTWDYVEGCWQWPTAGMWEGWYWHDEIALARAVGWRCDALEGWLWR